MKLIDNLKNVGKIFKILSKISQINIKDDDINIHFKGNLILSSDDNIGIVSKEKVVVLGSTINLNPDSLRNKLYNIDNLDENNILIEKEIEENIKKYHKQLEIKKKNDCGCNKGGKDVLPKKSKK